MHHRVCFVGERIMSSKLPTLDNTDNTTVYTWCNKNETGPLYHTYCPDNINTTEDEETCNYFKENDVGMKRAIPGLASGVIKS